ncbi:hypothetical protein B0H10DRAFT_1346838 [Mycena sp. CBHHK59/15]|nr:hypothetical protein B0H10DRAFT_1346838 [Mycena sp. CBHHK59/15]
MDSSPRRSTESPRRVIGPAAQLATLPMDSPPTAGVEEAPRSQATNDGGNVQEHTVPQATSTSWYRRRPGTVPVAADANQDPLFMQSQPQATAVPGPNPFYEHTRPRLLTQAGTSLSRHSTSGCRREPVSAVCAVTARSRAQSALRVPYSRAPIRRRGSLPRTRAPMGPVSSSG